LAWDGTFQRKKLTIDIVGVALLVILGSLLPVCAKAPAPTTAKRAIAASGTGTPAPASLQTRSFSAASVSGVVPDICVAVVTAPPFIIEQNRSLTGFSIDLWNAIATQQKMKTSYQIMPDTSSVEGALRSKRADLTFPAAITSARDEVFDFSFPILETGLQIMIRETGAKPRADSRLIPVIEMLRLLFSPTTIEWIGVGLLLVLIPAHLAWFLERRHPDGIISNRNYFPGIFEALFWGLSALACQAMDMPRQWITRCLSIFWMFASVVFIASYTAQLTTTLTVEQIRGDIEGLRDLPGKQVATIRSSPAADYLREQRAQVQEFSPDQMFTALLDKRVDAVVAPAPVLLYYAAHEGKGRVRIVGPEFERGQLAILVQLNSPLRKKVNRALLELRENGTYQQLYDKWFGNP